MGHANFFPWAPNHAFEFLLRALSLEKQFRKTQIVFFHFGATSKITLGATMGVQDTHGMPWAMPTFFHGHQTMPLGFCSEYYP